MGQIKNIPVTLTLCGYNRCKPEEQRATGVDAKNYLSRSHIVYLYSCRYFISITMLALSTDPGAYLSDHFGRLLA